MVPLVEDMRAVWRARTLVWVLAKREIAARNAGSAGGWVWSYIQPLLMVGAYYLVFDVVFAMRLGEGAPTRAVGAFLVVGALPWMAFCDAFSRAMNSLVEAGSLLQRSPLPPVFFPVRSALASGVIFGPLLLLMAAAYAPLHRFDASLLAVIPLLALQLTLSVLIGYLFALFAAAMRDTMQIVAFLLSIGIFVSPVLFPINMFPEAWRWVLWGNPMTGLVTGYQSVLLQGDWPALSSWASTAVWIGVLAVVLNAVIGRSRDQLADWL